MSKSFYDSAHVVIRLINACSALIPFEIYQSLCELNTTSSIERAASGRLLVSFRGFKNMYALKPLDGDRYLIEKYNFLESCESCLSHAGTQKNEFGFRLKVCSDTGFPGPKLVRGELKVCRWKVWCKEKRQFWAHFHKHVLRVNVAISI